MSLVAEIIAKHLGERENLDSRRIVQLLASYKSSTPDVRRDLSGLKDWEEEILCECANSLKELESNYCRELDIFDLIGTEREVAERIKIEIERKREILPFIIKNAREFANRIAKNLYMLTPMIFLRGSASPKSPKLFIYYDEENGRKIFVSDVDVYVIFPYYPDREIKEYVRREARKFSLEREIPIDAFITGISSIDEGLLKYGYPLLVPYDEKQL